MNRPYFLLVFIVFLLPLHVSAAAFLEEESASLSTQEKQRLHEAITGYYQHPTPANVESVLDIMNGEKFLLQKTAHPPLVGFLSIAFAQHKKHLFNWMARHDYHEYAQDVFIAALLHAKLTESASVFAQAHRWTAEEMKQLRSYKTSSELLNIDIAVPGHIDALWGAFFASGDARYVKRIIDVLFMTELPKSAELLGISSSKSTLSENKDLARSSLKEHAAHHAIVRNAIDARIRSEKNAERKKTLKSLI